MVQYDVYMVLYRFQYICLYIGWGSKLQLPYPMTHQTCDGENPPFLVEVYGGLAPPSCLGFPRFPLLSPKFQMLVLPDDFTSAMNFVGVRGVVRCCSFGFVLHWRCLVFVSFGGYLYSSLVAYHAFWFPTTRGDYCSNMVTDDPLGSSHFCDLSIDLDMFKHHLAFEKAPQRKAPEDLLGTCCREASDLACGCSLFCSVWEGDESGSSADMVLFAIENHMFIWFLKGKSSINNNFSMAMLDWKRVLHIYILLAYIPNSTLLPFHTARLTAVDLISPRKQQEKHDTLW